MSAEFKKDQRDGTLKLLEINARPWWHCWLSGKCGVDIIFSAYLDALGEKSPYSEQYKEGIESIYLALDAAASLKMFLAGDLNLKTWMVSLLDSKIFAFYEKGDSFPLIKDLTKNFFKFRN